MEQAKIRPSVILLPGPIITKLGVINYVGDPYWYANIFGRIWFGGEFPANTWNITSLWLFVVSLFSCTRLEQKPVNGFARSMSQNAWNQASMCLLRVSSKKLPNPNIFKIPKILYYESSFSRKTRINLGGSAAKNSHSNRKQPMGISNLWLQHIDMYATLAVIQFIMV